MQNSSLYDVTPSLETYLNKKKPALSVTNYVNVRGRSRVPVFASHAIS